MISGLICANIHLPYSFQHHLQLVYICRRLSSLLDTEQLASFLAPIKYININISIWPFEISATDIAVPQEGFDATLRFGKCLKR